MGFLAAFFGALPFGLGFVGAVFGVGLGRGLKGRLGGPFLLIMRFRGWSFYLFYSKGFTEITHLVSSMRFISVFSL